MTEVLLEDVLAGKRAVVEITDTQCRKVLMLLVRRIRRENKR